MTFWPFRRAAPEVRPSLDQLSRERTRLAAQQTIANQVHHVTPPHPPQNVTFDSSGYPPEMLRSVPPHVAARLNAMDWQNARPGSDIRRNVLLAESRATSSLVVPHSIFPPRPVILERTDRSGEST